MAMGPGRASMGFILNQQEIANRLLRYWTDFAHWMRALYISTMYGLNNREPIRGRLMRNAADFTQILNTYYGEETGRAYEKIITELYENLFQMSEALYRHEMEEAARLNTMLYNDIDDMVALLKSINRNLDEEALRKWLYELLYLTLEEAVMIYADEYEESVRQSDKIVNLAADIAQEMAYQLINQLQYGGAT